MPFLQFSAPPLPHYVASGEDTYGPGDRHPSRKHIGVFDLLLVTRGQLFMGEGDEQWVVAAGQTLILLPHLHHFPIQPCVEETHFYWLHFQSTGRWTDIPFDAQLELDETSIINPASADPSPDEDEELAVYSSPSYLAKAFPIVLPRFGCLINTAKTFEDVRTIMDLEQYPDRSARWQQQWLFQEVLRSMHAGIASFEDVSAVRLAQRAASFIRRNYRLALSYQLLRDNLNFHPVYVARCMQRVYGCSPIEYLTRYRIEQSKLLLLNTNTSIQQVAEEVGFHHFSYFSRSFAKIEGVTPREYRKRYHI